MHIPAHMLQGSICPVTAGVSAVGVLTAGYLARQSSQKPSAMTFASVTAMIFAGQMLNFPISQGMSGHVMGGMLAASLLGTPFAVLSLTIVLTIQAFLFGDGGINALGSNILNMAIVGVSIGALMRIWLKRIKLAEGVSIAIASWVSVMAAASFCSMEVAQAGMGAFHKVLPAMLGTHAWIGIGEALMTVAVVSLVKRAGDSRCAFASLIFAATAVCVSPFASPLPDGLEWVSTQLGFLFFVQPSSPVLFPNYTFPGFSSVIMSTFLASVLGLVISLGFALFVGKVFFSNPKLRTTV